MSEAPLDLNKYTFMHLLEIRDNYDDCDEGAIAEIIDTKGCLLEQQLEQAQAENKAQRHLIERMLGALKRIKSTVSLYYFDEQYAEGFDIISSVSTSAIKLIESKGEK